MNKLFIVIFFTLFYQVDFLVASDCINEFKTRLKAEQINFLSSDIQDVESIKAMIFTMYELDQEFRTIYIHDRNNHDIQNFMFEIDQFHTQKMKDIITSNGWLAITRFGKDTDHQAWLLVQHADRDQEFQSKCLDLLTDLYQKGETDSKNYAYLYDRVALVSQDFGMKQKYGTQYFMSNDDEISLRPHDGTVEDVNTRRNEVGLCSIEEYFERIQRMHKKN